VRRLLLLALGALLALPAVAAALPLVAIDPGHGAADTGARGVLPNGTPTGLPTRIDRDGRTLIYEKDVNLDVALRLDTWLRARGFRTVLTRTKDLAGGDLPWRGTTADLKARTDLANAAGADLFVSIHNNSFLRSSSGTETFHFYYATRAAQELAKAVHAEVVLRLGLPDRGVRSAGFYVLRHTVMPAVLVEGAFLSNPREALLLARPDVRRRFAEGVGAGIVRYAQGIRVPPSGYGRSAQPAPLQIRYWVTVGAFRSKVRARRLAQRLSRQDIQTLVKSRYSKPARRSLFFVVTGQFIFLQNARTMRNSLRRHGLPARVGPAPGIRA
jgi:N-acetylmuramoyl-L-alanine amidase